MELGLYVHIPFCKSKCHYCDFLSYSRMDLVEEYVNALNKEIKSYGQLFKNTQIQSIFIGGGTPTVLPPYLLEQIYNCIVDNFVLSEDCEWTIEANPDTVTNEQVVLFRKYPINRISLGLQAVQDYHLKNIGRVHSFKQWENAIFLLKSNGITNINTDLIFGLPNQTLQEWEESLNTVVKYNIPHISAYSLTLEGDTKFTKMYEKGELTLADETLDRQMYNIAKDILNSYNHYEISNWAKNGKECKHNILYWKQKQYIGVGLGASGYISSSRYTNIRNLKDYIMNINNNNLSVQEGNEYITPRMQQEEFMFLGLRMRSGIDINEFQKLFGVEIYDIFGNQIDRWIKQGVIRNNNNNILNLTDYGIDISNIIFASFLNI
ncbi:hypothetical protein AN639_06710 [Candidatus Epulonipiscium fishelsonii]|uniref:Uncharacterized protein n=1 Tax=Candidatus Epulonipiscium fishelsonii TaxID=77094 RepID=A0ACC8XGL1_9FIRM|nr:hypothetical protein AN639_06710 [Epulopiscium sp. SCG-B05WGA-EpuloA1]ONI42773.1 hypothetical protein AN396_13320 [Epulopiscium sp. SCG-B11WGA-EpuloA1]